MRAANPVHLILLDSITQITFYKTYTFRGSSLCNFLQVLDIYSLTDTNICLSILGVCPFPNMRNYATHPHQTKYIKKLKVIFTIEQAARIQMGRRSTALPFF
jgi:hypothetical protein